MTPEQQRIKIAEACGWSNVKIYPRSESNKRHSEDTESIGIGCRHPSWGGGSCSVPNYPYDLNAMHEAEKTKFNENYWLEWENVVARMSLPRGALPLTIWIARMTAAQRAEAFLKTLSLWTEE